MSLYVAGFNFFSAQCILCFVSLHISGWDLSFLLFLLNSITLLRFLPFGMRFLYNFLFFFSFCVQGKNIKYDTILGG